MMKVKGIVAIITALTLVFSLFISANAYDESSLTEDKIKLMIAAGEIPPVSVADESTVSIKKDKAVEIAKSLLNNPKINLGNAENYQLNYSSLSKRWDTDGYVWNLQFNITKAPGGSVSVNVDADTGEIIYFDYWEMVDGTKNYVAQVTREEARILAEEFLADVMKYDVSSLDPQREKPYSYYYKTGGVKEPVVYYFNYWKKYNDIPLYNTNISVGIDATTKKVKSYSLSMPKVDPSKFPVADKIISADEAIEGFRESSLIPLQYVAVYSDKPYGPSEQKTVLAYVPVGYINMIDAQTGKVFNPYNDSNLENAELLRKLYLEPSPLNPDAVLTGRKINEASARRIANDIKKKVEKLLDVSFDPSPESYDMPVYSSNEQDIWYYNWGKYDQNGRMAYLSVSINGKTGHVLNIGISSWDNAYDRIYMEGSDPNVVTENVTWEEGKEKALDIIKTLLPDQYGFFADHNVVKPEYSTEAEKYNREHYYTFNRVINGIVHRDNFINVSIDRETGVLRNFSFNWSDHEFPSASVAISSQEALDIFAQGLEAKLVYFLHSSYDEISGRALYSETPALVYNLSVDGLLVNGMMLDAKTGKFIDWSGREILVGSPVQAPDLDEHWAKRSIELLFAQGILNNPNIDYEAEVTRYEAVKMVSLAKGMLYYDPGLSREPSFPDVSMDNEYYYYIENAVRQKLISADGNRFNGDEKVTKEEFARLLVGLMGYSDIARYSDIFKAGSEVNVSKDMIGYVAVCRALGVLPGKPGEVFDAGSKVTYAEAAVALYNALKYIK